jgi:phosphatidylglycerol lysyltransferase
MTEHSPHDAPALDATLARAHAALRAYGYQSQSYNILTGDKSFYFSNRGVDGFIAYVVVSGVALVAGDPVCAEGDIRNLCWEFLSFCNDRGWRPAFQAVTERTLQQLQYLEFGFLKIGEEPFFRLQDFTLAGGQFRDLRRDINRAKSDGMTTLEYQPLSERDESLEAQMRTLSEEWQQAKGSGEFGFLVGQPSLDSPGDRKFFIAMLEGSVEAFCVCTPVYARNAVYFDLLRRKAQPVRGTVELLITDSFRQLKEQGYELATLGTSPLSGEHVEDPAQSWFIELAMDIAFDRLGYFYSFKPIYQFKEQFGPDFWEPRFLAYHPARFNPVVIYALLKAYDPAAVTHLSQKQLGAAWDGVKWLASAPVDVAEWLVGVPLDVAERVMKLALRTPMPGMPGIPGLPALPGLPGLPDFARLPDMPGVPGLARLRRMATLGWSAGSAGADTDESEKA